MNMKKLGAILVVAILAMTVVATSAFGHKSHRANTYKAKLVSSGVTPATGPTSATGPTGVTAATSASGKASAVQNKKYFKIVVHVKGINSGVSYPAHVHEDVDGLGCASTTNAPTIPLPNIVGNPAGNGKTKLKQKHATVDRALAPTKKYYVNVHNPTGESIACGNLVAKKKGKSDGKGKGKGKGKGHK